MGVKRQNKFLTAFGRAVRMERKSKGWSQETLADKAGLDPTYVGRIERGEQNATLLICTWLARALGITTAELFAMADAFDRRMK